MHFFGDLLKVKKFVKFRIRKRYFSNLEKVKSNTSGFGTPCTLASPRNKKLDSRVLCYSLDPSLSDEKDRQDVQAGGKSERISGTKTEGSRREAALF